MTVAASTASYAFRQVLTSFVCCPQSKQAPSTLSKMTTVLDGAKLPTMPLTGPVSESKFALTAKERLKAEVRAKHLGLLAQAIRPPATTGVVVETKKHVVQSSLLLSSTATTPGKVDFVNYEMTDTESDSDDESETSQNKPAKRIPEWSRREKLLKALKLQYSCDYPIDPDVLFGEVETCDLEEVFNKKSKMYRRRNSSGDWTKDRVTSEEKLAYKLAVA